MAARKGHKKRGGRAKGTPNKVTKTVREAFLYAFQELQKDPKKNLVTWGKRSPNAFYTLASKLIPVELKAQITSVDVDLDISKFSEEELDNYEDFLKRAIKTDE